ncbi:RcnB family protein [Sphingomonas xinjiangensis]|uniref:Ni/Co efflux regulator RcnB n=1 Tax=Sphingomonas xinjiangensis TaxID=643568 RepID=A0A840YP62_9SPHN|nr:RcnB family protein [Sphingomonas xinjiangensis]MBB5711960.1 Ni/Co efflux regulator RcnB [Sphingomonas xinjiangensis]
MRKFITAALLAAVALPTAAAPAAASTQSNRELRRDRQDIREERRDLRDAYRRGDARDIRRERRDVRQAHREYREDLRDRDRAWGRDDWRRYRTNNRAVFARGSWNAPFRYTRFRPGLRIGSPYYGTRYVIADPWRYHLPRAARHQSWVRHYNDVLLVDTRRGTVINVLPGFYW